jgi:hypothetical protein
MLYHSWSASTSSLSFSRKRRKRIACIYTSDVVSFIAEFRCLLSLMCYLLSLLLCGHSCSQELLEHLEGSGCPTTGNKSLLAERLADFVVKSDKLSDYVPLADVKVPSKPEALLHSSILQVWRNCIVKGMFLGIPSAHQSMHSHSYVCIII